MKDLFPERVADAKKRMHRLWLPPALLSRLEAFIVAFLGNSVSTDAVALPFLLIEQQHRFCLASFDQARAYDCIFSMSCDSI